MKVIAIIGIDGAGKSTLAGQLVQTLEERRLKVKLFPMKKYNNEVINHLEENKILETSQEMKLSAYSLDLYYQCLKAMEEKTDYVVFDRYSYCLTAYFESLGIKVSWVEELLGCIRKPDYTFWLKLSVPEAVKRLKTRDVPVKPLENEVYLSKVQERYSRLSNKYNFIKLDAMNSMQDLCTQALNYMGE